MHFKNTFLVKEAISLYKPKPTLYVSTYTTFWVKQTVLW